MNLLAIESSTETLSLALQTAAGITAFDAVTGPAASQRILPEIQRLLSAAECTLTQLDGIVYGMGPGAFTGVRVAVGVTQGLAFGAQRPVVGINALLATAESAWLAHGVRRIIVCLDARMGEVYHAVYTRQTEAPSPHSPLPLAAWQMQTAPMVCKPQEVVAVDGDGWWGVGSGWGVYAALLQSRYGSQLAACDAQCYPKASAMLSLAGPMVARGEVTAAEMAAPLYVRNRVALTAAERAQGMTL